MTDLTEQAFSSAFVADVLKLLSNDSLAVLNGLPAAGATTQHAILTHFLNHLFARATIEALRNQSAARVAHITNSCFQTIAAMPSADDRISTALEYKDDVASLFIALDDRPFIISSVAERLSEAGVRVISFLHPILSYRGVAIALSYVEFSDTTEVDTTRLLAKVRETLRTLKQVVHDFPAMITSVLNSIAPLSSDSLRVDFGEISCAEVRAFISWLTNESFFFIGTALWNQQSQLVPSESWGAWRVKDEFTDQLRSESAEDLRALKERGLDLSIRKLELTSSVHRPAPLLNITLRLPDNAGESLSLVGYLTSKAWTNEALDIPILRHKVARFLALEGALPNSHDYKYMVEVVDNMPTDEALASSVEQLRMIARLALGVFSHEATRTITFIDELRRRALTVIALPPERLSAGVRQDIQDSIEVALQAATGSTEIHLDSSKRRQYRLYLSTPLPLNHSGVIPQELLSKEIHNSTLTWEEHLSERLAMREGPEELEWRDDIFPAAYQAGTDVHEAAFDVRTITSLSHEKPSAVMLYVDDKQHALPVVSIFSRGAETSISNAIAVLENIGIEVLRAHSYGCNPASGHVNILKLIARTYDNEPLDPEHFNRAISPELAEILRGSAINDPLNLLLRKIPIDIPKISLLRGYCALLWQVNKLSTKRTMWKALAQAPSVALQLCRIFELKFDPVLGLSLDERNLRIAQEELILSEALRLVPDITHDRILRALLSLLHNTVRTNFYSGSKTLALKLTPRHIEIMPHPRPLFEVFVFSSRIEGTHLRSAKVSRGGIRWSERLEDFRSEILGLMKTQRIKNVIIVPSGAKGGFILKHPLKHNENLPQAIEAGYREYIATLLSIADSKRNGVVVHPENTLVYDEPDPYFVVAADKGTATFSDIANSIAQKDFDYWLGDAFASGGSAGYDHKKHGITAKGAWECVQRHFHDLGINCTSQSFTVVGIGDMSGDVFGNALILSRFMRLIAAFNHKHIFLDPSPDLDKGLAERLRLFNTPRSQWSDYASGAISQGGGIFNRFDKEITLSPEARQALSIADDVPNVVDGEKLISLILRAQVELLWNGGIGTYVKGQTESQADVNDGTNDGVRINANELRARIVGEGGNLGLTQKARIEFSLQGGRVNTDAIDNSGGVDLSDHEVNLKLLFAPLLGSHDLSITERNKILQEIATDVVESVLKQNRNQALMLSISALQSKTSIEQYRYLIRDMNKLGYLDRARDVLPDEQEIDERTRERIGMTRPELVICSAATKMWVKEEIRSSRLCSDHNLEHFLLSYFPKRIGDDFTTAVLEHSLRADIIASCVVNEILPAVGIPFVHNMVSLNNTTVPNAMKCILAADEILGFNPLRGRLHTLDTPTSCQAFTELWLDMGSALRESSVWLLNTHGLELPLGEIVKLYASAFETLSKHASLVFIGQELVRFERRIEHYRSLGASQNDAILFSLCRRILPVLEVLWSAREFKHDVKVVASVYSLILEELAINTLFKYEQLVESSNKWEQELVSGSYQEIRRSISLLTGQLLKRSLITPQEVSKALHAALGYEAIRTTMADVEEATKQKRPFQVAVLPVISRQLRLLAV